MESVRGEPERAQRRNSAEREAIERAAHPENVLMQFGSIALSDSSRGKRRYAPGLPEVNAHSRALPHKTFLSYRDLIIPRTRKKNPRSRQRHLQNHRNTLFPPTTSATTPQSPPSSTQNAQRQAKTAQRPLVLPLLQALKLLQSLGRTLHLQNEHRPRAAHPEKSRGGQCHRRKSQPKAKRPRPRSRSWNRKLNGADPTQGEAGHGCGDGS